MAVSGNARKAIEWIGRYAVKECGFAGREWGEDGVIQGRNGVSTGLCREGMG
jgi:hypothetical protein